ncbi:NADH dehydrogenase (ubiquinone) 1 beta subcomplex 9 [Fusarium phyllophilum]|uniref:NADH dehydrogenase (Ubiquinone) 1 beta subcomplex 9 n=1 Tax=Fusarium phyllophilum TaxID=47803 RepID=A0A8H5MMZ7_9HYPO|nr:NADH dehydrogenase (ubiquinone) 1 beta subcomplex 9 [Fusarium phyllophilum]
MSPIPGIKGFVTNWRLEYDLGADFDAQALLTETEKLLESWKHPDPYTPPTAPGGSKFERNLPSPVLDPPPHPVNRH